MNGGGKERVKIEGMERERETESAIDVRTYPLSKKVSLFSSRLDKAEQACSNSSRTSL